jgi:hypothetical protein
MRLIIISLLILTSCSERVKNCNLVGKWKSIEFISNKAIDWNNDGIYNKELLKEDKCTEVIFEFKNNGKIERYYKNKGTNCEFKKSTLNYVVDGNEILFTVSGMRQKHKFEINNCILTFYGIKDRGMTKNGKQNILISSKLKKQ